MLFMTILQINNFLHFFIIFYPLFIKTPTTSNFLVHSRSRMYGTVLYFNLGCFFSSQIVHLNLIAYKRGVLNLINNVSKTILLDCRRRMKGRGFWDLPDEKTVPGYRFTCWKLLVVWWFISIYTFLPLELQDNLRRLFKWPVNSKWNYPKI